MDFIPYKKTKSVKKVNTTIRVDRETLEKIDAVARKAGISRNELINQCVDYSINSIRKNIGK